MQALVFVSLFMVIAAALGLSAIQNGVQERDRMTFSQSVRQTAYQGVQVFQACEQEASSGVFSVASMIAAGDLPQGYPSVTPMGNQWICEVTTGGPGGKAVLVTWNQAPLGISGLLEASLRNSPGFEANVVGDVAEIAMVKSTSSARIMVGTVAAGSTTLKLTDAMASYSLAGMMNSQSFDEPVIAAGLTPSS